MSFSIVYIGADQGYTLKGHGFIAHNGSVSGTATGIRGNTLTFTMPNGSAFEVLRYTAPVAWAVVYRHGNASFGYTIPKWLPKGLAGLHIAVKVHDGGFGVTPTTRPPAAIFSSARELGRPTCGPSSRGGRTFVSPRATAAQ